MSIMSGRTHTPRGTLATQNAPEELRSYRQWVAWRSEQNGNGKVTKIPVNPHTGTNASTRNPATWGAYQEALAYYAEHGDNGIAGIGFVFTEDDPYCGIDLDNCVNPETGKIEEWAMEVLREIDSYCEISPSNTGVKIFCKGSLPGSGRNFGDIEMYDTGRYFTLTGNRLEGYPASPEERSGQVQRLYQKLCGGSGKPVVKQEKTDDGKCDLDIDSLKIPYGTKKLIREGEEQGSRSNAIMSVLDSLVHAGVPDSDIFTIFESFPIGEKYKEKGKSKERWLQNQIDKARNFTNRENKGSPETSIIFPYQVMSGAAGRFTEVYGGKLETPKEFLFMSYLTCLGSVLSKRVTLASEIAPQPRLYTLLLGQSADERKSTSLKKAVDHFKETLRPFNVCWGVGSAEGLQKKMEDIDSGLLLCFDEFRQFVSKCKIDASVLLPCVNTLFESNRYESRTKTTNIELSEAYLSLLAASTVDVHKRTWDSSFTDIGFTNRLFLVPGTAKRKYSFPEKIAGEDKQILRTKLLEVIDHVGTFKELSLTSSAKELYHKWYMKVESSIHAKRLDVYALRLMALLAVNDLKNEVDKETVGKAIALCDWQLEVRKMYDPIDADNKIAKLEETIRRLLRRGSKTESELKQGSNANRAGLWAYEKAKKNLLSAKEITLDKRSKKWTLVQSQV
jgi:hypothetical protein